MNATDLTPEQLARLTEQVRRVHVYLRRLSRRMEQRGWSLTDPIYLNAVAALDKVYSLSVHLHYAGCDSTQVCGAYQPTPPPAS